MQKRDLPKIRVFGNTLYFCEKDPQKEDHKHEMGICYVVRFGDWTRLSNLVELVEEHRKD